MQNCPKPVVTNLSNKEFIETDIRFSSIIFALHLHLISVDISIGYISSDVILHPSSSVFTTIEE